MMTWKNKNSMSTAGNPALVLNADFRPLSYYPFLYAHGRMLLNLFF